ncbi:MAG TPA: EAL domain-containing protein [Chloroflexota bacterium]|nr:EAL domain-containing protein [Chloroflexota bacterium]
MQDESGAGFVGSWRKRPQPLHILGPSERIAFERLFLWLRLAFVLTPLMLVFGQGLRALPTAGLVLVPILADCGLGWILLYRFERYLVAWQLNLRIVDLTAAYLALILVDHLLATSYYDAAYIFFVVGATATHGRRGTALVSAAAMLLVFLERLQLMAWGLQPFKEQFISDSLYYGLLFLATGSITTFLMRKSAEALHDQAFHDPLTGLPNRALLHDRLDQAVRAARRSQGGVAVLLLDLDGFKAINDTFGHGHGDQLLTQVAHHLARTLRDSDTIARLGGDEFAVLLPDTDAEGALTVGRAIVQCLDRPFLVEGACVDVSVSIGIALCPDQGDDSVTLLKHADVAMYHAKRGKLGVALYAAECDEYTPGRLARRSDLRHAIESNELFLLYQPVMETRTGAIYTVEALVRWNHPREGLIRPDLFIPLAEQTGLIWPLTVWVMRQALTQLAIWRARGLNLRVAINLSAQNLHDPRLVPTVRQVLSELDVRPEHLVLEVTESSLMVDVDQAREALFALTGLGVQVAIDDFGTGYSSLSYLHDLPAEELKIDRSFVLDVRAHGDGALITQAVIDLGHKFGLQVVAEGVEDRETADRLAHMACDRIQGYYLSPPLSVDELPDWLSNHNPNAAAHGKILRLDSA